MTFNEAIALQPSWVQIWLNVMGPVIAVSTLISLINASTRRIGLVIIMLVIPSVATTLLLYNQMGYVRLLGLGHVIFWTPLAIYLMQCLKRGITPAYAKIALVALLVVLLISLCFDYVDVVRWILGERAPLI